MNVKTDWQGKWINPELNKEAKKREPASYLRRTFTVKNPGKASLAITVPVAATVELPGLEIAHVEPGTHHWVVER